MVIRLYSKYFKLGFSSTWIKNCLMYKLGLKRQSDQRSNCQHSLDHRKSIKYAWKSRKLKMLKIYWDANLRNVERTNVYESLGVLTISMVPISWTRILNRVLYYKYGQGVQSIEDVEAPGESQECEALGVEKLMVTKGCAVSRPWKWRCLTTFVLRRS